MIDLDSLDGINIINDTSDFHTQHRADTSSSSATITSFPSITSMSQRSKNLLTCMLITANVGTIFEESTLLELWFQQLKSYLIRVRPQLVAIHCQEVGGKNYESSMKNVSNFTDKIIGDESIVGDYSRVRIFLDENFESLEKFTALGSLYLVHDSVDNVKLYNFKTAQYEFIEGRSVFAANSTNSNSNNNNKTMTTSSVVAEHVEKVKFPQELFPECRWSRKGFMRTRWLFNDSQPLDLVNIHLFHDASNLIAMETTPSPYAQNRQRALEFALKRISVPLKGTWGQASQRKEQTIENQVQQKQSDEVPLFIFGDFNFRLDTNKVIHRITEGVQPVIKRSADSNEVLEFIYHRKSNNNIKSFKTFSTQNDNVNDGVLSTSEENTIGKQNIKVETKQQDDDGNFNYLEGSSGVVMTVGKKLFDCENLDEMFRATKNTEWLLELDNELDSFKSQLYEFKISFSPSYPFKEDTSGGYSYMKTRCPAWCDRILFNAAGNRMIHSKSIDTTNMDSEKRIELLQNQGDVIYRLMGNSVPMGDHKPVLLYCQLNMSQNPSVKCNLSSDAANNESNNLVESTTM